jgi:hypothetical protein
MFAKYNDFVSKARVSARGVRRIGLTSLNPMVCLNSQSESDPKMKKAIRSEKNVHKIRSDPMLKFIIRSDPNLSYVLYTACVNYSVYERIFS